MRPLKRSLGLVVLPLVAAMALVASACDKPITDLVTIHYRQIGACNGFAHDGVLTSAGAGAAYVVFQVSSIENNGSGARDYTFDPAHLFVNTDPRAYADANTLATLNPFVTTGAFVPAHTTRTQIGDVVVIVPVSGGATEANNTAFTLLYETPAGSQGAFAVKDNVTQTQWPNTLDCTTITY